jgi:protein-S-isoprenylcysteine O-methyltransferase Ste14
MIKTMLSWILKAFLSKAMFAVILFLSAGTLNWLMGWIFIAIYLAFDIATAILVAPRHPDLLTERTKLGENVKPWDKVIVRLAAAYGPFLVWIVSGLQYRYNWQPFLPMTYQWIAAGITALGFAIVAWAMTYNAFFTVTARLQPERGQTVATGGPYHTIRHPGYLGAIIFNIATPLMLGSTWGLIPGVITSGLYVLRTSLEDKMLLEELEGYKEYTRTTHWRLIPGVW